MGRIKTKQVKRITRDLIKEFGDELNESFADNKQAVDQFVDVQSKKLRNSIAGYAARLKRKASETA